jgi:hypothetical protein
VPRGWIVATSGAVLATVGAVLAFALEASDPAIAGIRLEPLGVIVVVLGVGALVGGALDAAVRSSRGSTGEGNRHSWLPTAEGFRTVAGLIAVVVGIVGVVALALVTLTAFGPDADSSVVAIATSAFGVISAVIGAYLGIKTSAEQSTEMRKEAKAAQREAGAANAVVAQLPHDQRQEAEQAVQRARTEPPDSGR